MENLTSLSMVHAKELLEKREISSVELIEAHLQQIEKNDTAIHAYLEVFEDVREQAKAADKRREAGEAGALNGMPIALKDNILVTGKRVTAGSKILDGYHATYDATVTRKLKEAGAVLIGRTNCDEFAMGSSTENSAYGITRNPRDVSRVPGGSSGGSAASVAGDMALAALGSDTGGSIRQPAAFCGVVGLKPTYGSVSRHGLIAMGSSLDVIGPLTKTVADAELLFSVIRGSDVLDSTSLPETITTMAHEKSEIKKTLVIGVPRDFFKGIDERVLKNFNDTLDRLKALGHTVVDIELPTIRYSLAAYYVVMPAEASTNLARFDGVRFGLFKEGVDRFDDYKQTRGSGFGPEVRRRILLGTYVLSAGYYDAFYGKGTQARGKIRNEFLQAFKKVDVIATPTTPTPAFTFGEKSDPVSMYLGDIFTVPANMAGVPALSVPSGAIVEGGKNLPLGIQFMAPHLGEQTLFQIGKQVTGE